MSIFYSILLGIALIIVLIRLRAPIGPSILAGGLAMWAIVNPSLESLRSAALETVRSDRTYDLIFALYFVMCLEIQLRKSGTLKGMVEAFNRIFSSKKATLAAMPAFLGLLPSLGGARFSAPIVSAAAAGTSISAEDRAAINFWFRHVCEFASPIIPGMILACAIAGISISSLVLHMFWLSILAFALGWIFLIRPIPAAECAVKLEKADAATRRKGMLDIALAFGPVIVNVLLMMLFDVRASIAMGIVVVAMIPILSAAKRSVSISDVFLGAFDWRLIMNISAILYFIQILAAAGILDQIIAGFDELPLPAEVILAATSFVIGVLTGMSQGHVAIVMPIVAAMAPGSLDHAAIALAFGVAGQMVTPTHVCLTITIDYFKSDFIKTLKPIVLMEIVLLSIFSLYTWLTL